MTNLFVTGAAGFIGSSLAHLIHHHISTQSAQLNGPIKRVIFFDKLTYAGFKENIDHLIDNKNIFFIEGDIADFELTYKLFREHKITDILNLAAESHVDNSISGPTPFINTNILGTFQLLESARKYWLELSPAEKNSFRFLHVSTDEVFGELGSEGYFTEETSYSPNSPYSASKAASDHLVKAWHHTYKIPVLITNCSNNYGPRQFPEKLIPRIIDCALNEMPLPVYGKGENVRDWIHVDDHSEGILLALAKGKPGESYCFGGRSERKNIEVVNAICNTLDEIRPRKNGAKYSELIQFVIDRAGHDFRYAIDDSKSEKQLGFKRKYQKFEDGLQQTIKWYLNNSTWIDKVKSKKAKGL